MNENIAVLLKKKRKENGLSVKDVLFHLQRYGISLSEKTIYGWESGHRQPDADTFLVLCEIYKVQSLRDFFRVTEKPATDNGSGLDDNEQTLVNTYRDMTPKGQQVLLDTAEALHGNFKKSDYATSEKGVG